jgi:NADH dehydrogenase
MLMINSMNQITTPTKTKVVVVGGGFGGVRAAEQLSKHASLDITLISNTDAFSYYPQLYHAATGGSRSESSIPLKEVLEGSKVTLIVDTLTTLDADKKTIHTANGTSYEYDQLILAIGSVTNYFGITGLIENSFDIKTIEGAERFKRHLHDQLITEHKPELDYVIVGAGPTGIELASALGDYLHRIVKLHNIKHGTYSIDLIEAAPRILPRSSERFASKISARLTKLGVKVLTNSVVQQETVDELILKDSKIRTKTVVWTAGIANNPFFKAHNNIFTLSKIGKVEVDAHLEGAKDVYVIGDNAATQYSGMAQTAVIDADFVARDLVAKLSGANRRDYKPKLPASVIPVGGYWAAAQIGRVELYGILGWMVRRIADLIAYSDIESKPKALAVWLKETVREDECTVCMPGSTVRAKA